MKTKLVTLLVGTLALAFFVTGCNEPMSRTSYTITVVEALSKRPIAGATVEISYPSSRAEVPTDSDGIARFGISPEMNEASIEIKKPGYDSASLHLKRSVSHEIRIALVRNHA